MTTFSLIAPDNTVYPLTATGTGWWRQLEDAPIGAIGHAPIQYQTVTLPGRNGVELNAVRVTERYVDIPLALLGASLTNIYSAIRPLYRAASVGNVTAPCRLRAVHGASTYFLDLHFAGDVWSTDLTGPGGVSRRVALRFIAPQPYWYSASTSSASLALSDSNEYNYIAQRNLSGSTAGWVALGSAMNGNIYALAVAPDGTLYAGGIFTTAGGVTVNRIARWNGTAWSALGTGMNGDVTTLVVAPDGTLYAGGDFTTAGGVTVNRVARWNGTAWSALGTGTSGIVYALAIGPDGALYAGGAFGTAGGVGVNNIARWDGTAWSALGSGVNLTVFAITIAPDGTLYAGGSFTVAGSAMANRVARWNGTAWSALGSGMDNSVYALEAASDGTLYAGGIFTTAGGVTVNRIARWNGTVWSGFGSGVNNEVRTLSVLNNTFYVGGNFTSADNTTFDRITHWNGYRFVRIDFSHNATYLWKILLNQNTLYITYNALLTQKHSSMTTVINNGSVVYPKLTFSQISGTNTIHFLQNATTDQRIWLNITLQPGETLTLDFDKATATSNWRGNVLGSVIPGSDMHLRLVPGSNRILLFALGFGTLTATLSWTERFATLAEALGT